MGPRSRHLLSIPAAILVALVLAVPALAHAELASSDPADKAVLATPPTVITLKFTEGLDRGKSNFKVSGPAGAAGTGRAARDGGKAMTLDGLALGPGAYAIKWTAVATDGHVSRGTLSFTVSEPTPAPATPTPTPVPTEAPGAAASAAPSDAPTAVPATPQPSPSPAAPASSAGADTGGDPAADPSAAAGSGGDVLIPIAVGLVLVAGIGALVLRRSRGA